MEEKELVKTRKRRCQGTRLLPPVLCQLLSPSPSAGQQTLFSECKGPNSSSTAHFGPISSTQPHPCPLSRRQPLGASDFLH